MSGLATSGSRQRMIALLLASVVGMSWFALARASFVLTRQLVLAGWWRGVPWWHVLSSVRLAIGLFVYVPVALVVARRAAAAGRRGSVILGLSFPTWEAAACGVVLFVGGVFAVGPTLVYSKVLGHLGSTLTSVLGGLQPPIIEEFLVRGIVWGILAWEFPAAFVLAWSSLLFWTWHIEFGLASSLITAGYSAVVLGGSRLTSGTIWVGLLFHLMANANAGQPLFPAVLVIGTSCVLVRYARSRRGRTRG